MTKKPEIIYENISEAIKAIEKNSDLLKPNFKFKPSNLIFNVLELPDGTLGAFPENMFIQYFRGENKCYDDIYPCVPSIFRSKNGKRDSNLVIIDKLKIIEFQLAVEQFPQIKQAINEKCNVHYHALAQHYGLNTDLLDITCNLGVAVFFATHYYDDKSNDYKIKKEGIGCLRKYLNTEKGVLNPSSFQLIGLQPFMRPGTQSAFGIKMNEDENFAKRSSKILFKQNEKANRKIHDLFYTNNQNALFPYEEVTQVADTIKKSKLISKYSIRQYCNENSVKEEEINKMLISYQYAITEELIVKLTRQQKRHIQRKYKNNPYGNIRLRAGICL